MAGKLISQATATTPANTDMIPLARPGDTTARYTTVSALYDTTASTLNVKEYGALGDGTTDDTATIAAAVAACPEGGEVYFPRGTYRLSGTITISKAITISGAGYESCIYLTTSDDGFLFDGHLITGGLNGFVLRDMTFEGGTGTGNAIKLYRCHRNRIENINIPTIGEAGLYLYGSILNTIINMTVSVNLPPVIATPVNPKYGVRMVADGSMTINSSTFVNLIVEGITTSPGIGVAIHDGAVSNIFVGGTSEGNTIGIQLGDSTAAGTTNNVFLAFHVESNTSDWDFKAASGEPEYNVVLGQFQVPPGITNFNYLFRPTVEGGTSTNPAIRFYDDLDTGFYRAGTAFAIAHGGAIQFSITGTNVISYKNILPGSNDALDIGDLSSGLRFRNIDITQYMKANRMRVELLTAEPADKTNGMIVYANGTDWDPGSGAGFYGREAGAWVKL